jgi:hypothetical protein
MKKIEAKKSQFPLQEAAHCPFRRLYAAPSAYR